MKKKSKVKVLQPVKKLTNIDAQERIRKFRGKLKWESTLDEMRTYVPSTDEIS